MRWVCVDEMGLRRCNGERESGFLKDPDLRFLSGSCVNDMGVCGGRSGFLKDPDRRFFFFFSSLSFLSFCLFWSCEGRSPLRGSVEWVG